MSPAAPPLAGATALDQRFALDLQGLDALRRAARQAPDEALKQVSRQFEALFMGMLLKSMRDATPSAGLLEGQNGKLYLSMLDQQLAQQLSGRGLRLGDAMFAQLRRSTAAAAPAADEGAGVASGVRPPAASSPDPARAGSAAPLPAANANPPGSAYTTAIRPPRALASSLPAVDTAAAARPAAAAPAPAEAGGGSGLQAHVRGFLAKLGDSARAAAAASGIPETLILAQAALESAWGRREVRGDDGAPSFNVFGIKADRSWRGPVTEATTTEFVDGVAQRARAKFRRYGSYQEAFSDYARFIVTNPRYSAARSQKDPASAAHALQRAGYASDPDYASKLVRVMKRLL